MPQAEELYYHDYSQGERLPVVLLHGAGGNYLSWPSEIRRMAGCHVFAVDLPGHGKSAGRGHQTIAAYAAAVMEWLAELQIPRAVLAGHSMGGAIALTLALEYPGLALGLALFGSAARMAVNPVLIEETASPTTFHNAVEKIIAWSFSPQAEANLTGQAAARLEATRPSVLHGDFLACDGFDVTARLGEIHVPALVVCGALDKMTPPRSAQFLADALPRARLEIIPEAGHQVMLERPDESAQVLADFLRPISL
ncbi:MAG: alpha/beta fold hydrolase [Chloroflexi bacterium]|nr:alpha/beta fold hydrolase [Chloroflexota bacterium]